MTKQIHIFHKLKANLKVLLMFCFVLLLSPNISFAQSDTIEVERIPSGTSSLYRQKIDDSNSGSSAFTAEQRQMEQEYSSSINGPTIKTTSFKEFRASLGDAINYHLDKLSDNIDSALAYHDDLFENETLKSAYKFVYRNVFQVLSVHIKGAISVVKTATTLVLGATNRECNKERMDSIYKDGCYSCEVVSALISSFMGSCTNLYGISKEVGHKILFLGFLLWIVFYVLQQIASLKSVEPANMVATMLTMAFKVLGAYVVIAAGIDFFISYAIIPFMQWGMEFGSYMLGLGGNTIDLNNSHTVGGSPSLTGLASNMQSYMAAVNYSVSTHMEIGHLITCHSTHAGALEAEIPMFPNVLLPNIWIWISGAFIWIMGFMMTYAVAFYLLDISFKLGFSVIALPIMVGLWPFNVTKNRLTACFGTILRTAGILLFLAVTVFVGLALIDNALNLGADDSMLLSENTNITEEMSGSDKIIQAIEDGDSAYISSQLSFWSLRWILIIFAYIFAQHIIGGTEKDFASKFFPSGVASETPMHSMLTQATSIAQSIAMNPVRLGRKVAAHQIKKGFRNAAQHLYRHRLKSKGRSTS